MKKKKLSLSRETVRDLMSTNLQAAAGGTVEAGTIGAGGGIGTIEVGSGSIIVSSNSPGVNCLPSHTNCFCTGL